MSMNLLSNKVHTVFGRCFCLCSLLAVVRIFMKFLDFTNPNWNSEFGGAADVTGSPRRRSQSRPRSPETGARVLLAPLPTHVAYDLKYVSYSVERLFLRNSCSC